MRRVFQRCSNSRFIGHTLSPAKMSCQVVGLHPYTSHWFLLLPHYKDVPSMPSSLQSLDDGVRCGCSKVTGYWCVPSTASKTRIKPPPHPSNPPHSDLCVGPPCVRPRPQQSAAGARR
ncbi:uncharacterized protein LOC126992964 isoform X2 [Eriocheir sinensis]|uniref:uncharacterized protein LOC126992964 isoform X2 n=1 Tax=Eriocheir sinensis TaxID=95602 RepID=UPI0021C8346F|nr:uncharacterized protein LOC126992964 isoform X2 [Eriocheir sinensis]